MANYHESAKRYSKGLYSDSCGKERSADEAFLANLAVLLFDPTPVLDMSEELLRSLKFVRDTQKWYAPGQNGWVKRCRFVWIVVTPDICVETVSIVGIGNENRVAPDNLKTVGQLRLLILSLGGEIE